MISYCHKLDVCLCVSLLLVYPDETARPGPSEWRTFGMADLRNGGPLPNNTAKSIPNTNSHSFSRITKPFHLTLISLSRLMTASTYVFYIHSNSQICDTERECISVIMMLMMTMTNDNDIASKFTITLCILFIFGQIVKTAYSVQP